MPEQKKAITSSAINGIAFIFNSAVIVVWYYLTVKNYTSSESGQLFLAMSIAGIVNCLDLGVSVAVVEIISRSRQGLIKISPRSIFLHSLIVLLVLQFVAVLIIFEIMKVSAASKVPYNFLVSTILFAIGTQSTLLCVNTLKGINDFRAANLTLSVITFLGYAGATILVINSVSAAKVFFLLALVQTVGSLYFVSVVFAKIRRIEGNRVENKISFIILAQILRISLPFFPQMFAGVFFNHIQRFFSASLFGLSSVGNLTLAYTVATRVHAVVNAFFEVLYPLARRLTAEKQFKITKAVLFASALYFLGIAPVIIAASYFSLMQVQLLLLFSLGACIAAALIPIYHVLNGTGFSSIVSRASLAAPISYSVVTLCLITLNANGNSSILAIAYIISMAISGIYVGYIYKKKAV